MYEGTVLGSGIQREIKYIFWSQEVHNLIDKKKIFYTSKVTMNLIF